MTRKPWTDPNPQLGRPGIARQFAATEEPKPPGASRSDTVEARRAAPVTGRRPVGAAPTDTSAVIANVHAMADKLEAERVERKRAKGRVLPKPPALGKSTISTGAVKLIKASELKPKGKGGRPRVEDRGKVKPWTKAGMSRASWYRRQGKSG